MSDHNTTQQQPEPQPRASTSQTQPKLARYTIALAVLVVVQLGLAAIVFWPQAGSAAGGEPLLGDLTLDDIDAMTITDNNDRAVRVERSDEGWVLAESDGYPAQTEAITTTLTSLLNMRTDRLVTRTEGSHNRLQVAEDNFMRRIDLETAEGDTTLYLGSSSGASATHVRLAGADATYLTNEVATWELDTLASSWIDINYVSLNADDITALTLENDNGRFEFVKENGEWTLADAEADETVAPANITTVVDRVASINMSRPLGTSEDPSYGMDSPSAVVTVQVDGEDGPQTYTLTQGPLQEEDALYPFKSSESPYYVMIAKFVGDELATKQRSDFLIAPEAQSEAGDDAAAPGDTVSGDTVQEDTVSNAGEAPTVQPEPETTAEPVEEATAEATTEEEQATATPAASVSTPEPTAAE